MTKLSLEKMWDLSAVRKVVIDNDMAPMRIETSADDKLHLEALVYDSGKGSRIDLEQYVRDRFEGSTFKLKLMGLPFSWRDSKRAMLIVAVPAGKKLKAKTENYPLSLRGLSGDIDAESENAPLALSDCTGRFEVESENGPVSLQNLNGDLEIELENAPLSAENIRGHYLKLESENGHVKMRVASFPKLKIKTENGAIYYETEYVENGDFELESENGLLHLVFPPNLPFELTAKSERGRIRSQLETELIKQETGIYHIDNRLEGTIPTRIRLKTENAAIKLSYDPDAGSGIIKVIMDQLRSALAKAQQGEELQVAKEHINKIGAQLSEMASSIKEENIKCKVDEAIEKMKEALSEEGLKVAKASVVAKADDLSEQIYENIKDSLKMVKTEFDEIKSEYFGHDALSDYINKVVESPLLKPYLGSQKKAEEDQIGERSRLKILQMLESGKITSEEAQQLLSAIDKD